MDPPNWVKFKVFFPRTLTIKGYSIQFYSQCSRYLLCLWVRVTFTGSEGLADLQLCYYSFLINVYLFISQWVKKCPLNSVLANPKRLHTNESALSMDWVHGRIISKVSVGLILLGQHVYVLIDFRVLCG